MATRQHLADIARAMALIPLHGFIDGKESNLQPLVVHFPKWNIHEADGLWCAAFVYHCCIEAGFDFPYSPDECITCNLAGCGGWEEFAMGDRRIEYHLRGDGFIPAAGDIVLYDRVFCGVEHDHIGVVLGIEDEYLVAAEGNIFTDNISGIVRRPMDEHIRAFIRLPDGYRYKD